MFINAVFIVNTWTNHAMVYGFKRQSFFQSGIYRVPTCTPPSPSPSYRPSYLAKIKILYKRVPVNKDTTKQKSSKRFTTAFILLKQTNLLYKSLQRNK